ncbi:hypothetical protein AVEN_122012-1 [Araneus ventricosus]|uniref:Uncharacterized protein n=1 Tax=Araneus ventricosus TaxID=182803 RepID=A0A4Y2RA89_ARAVE|nr:hypothetical protein AVEN_122012-1 [Araneus ventricosus]
MRDGSSSAAPMHGGCLAVLTYLTCDRPVRGSSVRHSHLAPTGMVWLFISLFDACSRPKHIRGSSALHFAPPRGRMFGRLILFNVQQLHMTIFGATSTRTNGVMSFALC